MDLPDATALTPEQREKAALRIKARKTFRLPRLDWFNYSPCERHAPDRHPLCSRCGIIPRAHQNVGAAFLYAGLPSLLADQVGSGKTAQALLLLAQCRQTGELGYHNRAVIITQPRAISDPWARELARLTPGLDVLIASGTPAEREEAYRGKWEVAVVSSRTFAPAKGAKTERAGDVELLMAADVGILITDDVDELRNEDTRTARAVNRLAARCSRVHNLHATPLQKRLSELYCSMIMLGVKARLGSLSRVKQRYANLRRKYITIPDPRDKTGRTLKRVPVWEESGVTRNKERAQEFRDAIAPIVLRRTTKDFSDVDVPEVQVSPVFLDLLPAQRRRYEELRAGVLRRLTEKGAQVTHAAAAAAFTRGRQICSGLATLDTGPRADQSVKLDWAMDKLTGDLSDEKVICFVYFRQNVAALAKRLRAAGIGYVVMWSAETNQKLRAERLRKFREDPRYRVLIGTTTIQTSLNLQVCRHMIGVDCILNPAAMEQLIGRMRRSGNPFPMVFLHLLLCRGTQEEGYIPLLAREQEVADVVWDERSDIRWVLSPVQLLNLIAYGSAAGRQAS